jgi:hypothetical protein
MSKSVISLAIVLVAAAGMPAAETKVPIIHSTDLFHPHADPDDHYDLACLFALDEFDIRGIVLDLGGTQAQRPGRPPVEQMMHITGRRCPYAIGLSRSLRTATDQALDEPAEFQGGVKLILSVLRESPEKVILHTTGSCRDVAAAFNREPALLREKVRAVYFNIGRGPNEPQDECNVGYDPTAYLRVFQSGLPLYWCPCFGKGGFETLYTADQTVVVGACSKPVQNFFVYCLTKATANPIEFLAGAPHPLPTGGRAMWCTAPMFHAAGRNIYQRGPADFVALRPAAAAKAGLKDKEVDVFRFVPMRVRADGPEAEPKTKLPQPQPGQLAAAYWGRTHDRVGTGRPEPDGRPDCCVRTIGVAPEQPIKNLVLTGPQEGRWEYVETGRWWRLAYERQGRQLDCWFQFYAAGEHQLEIVYEDGTKQSARFQVPGAAGAGPRVELDPAEPNGFVFRSTHPQYKAIMASCLKNLLAGLGR